MSTLVVVTQADPLQRLETSLLSLAEQSAAGNEVVLICQGLDDKRRAALLDLVERPAFLTLRIRRIGEDGKRGSPRPRSALFNTGLDAAGGRFIALLDVGDVLYPDAYERLTAALEAGSATVSVGSVLAVDERTSWSDATPVPRPGANRYDLFVENFCDPHSHLIDRDRTAAADLRFDETLHALEHDDLLLRLAVKYEFDFGLVGTYVGEARRWREFGRENADPEDLRIAQDHIRRLKDSLTVEVKLSEFGWWKRQVPHQQAAAVVRARLSRTDLARGPDAAPPFVTLTGDGVSLCASESDLSSDGWIGRRARVTVAAAEAVEQVVIEVWIPEQFEPRTVTARCGSVVAEALVSPGSVCPIALARHPDAELMEVELEVRGAAAGPPPDTRVLGVVIAAIRAEAGRR